ncbi:hypothetical protein [Trujillonella endophytica]|uniref:Uncharacterized protein n=1 Tax=Trujillonella endophytica TaxID=673521 RepID=A0A1H8PTW0_9ACTN|nr:hypothetical protein [Trujillella endophytica]SEO45206.1 hypothetical protein SAMN05660991_00370 [Trujillella endophytica]
MHRLADGAEVLSGEADRSGIPSERLAAAAEALRAAGRRWAALRPGEEEVLQWPGSRSRRR